MYIHIERDFARPPSSRARKSVALWAVLACTAIMKFVAKVLSGLRLRLSQKSNPISLADFAGRENA
jgi:hypothetical protein